MMEQSGYRPLTMSIFTALSNKLQEVFVKMFNVRQTISRPMQRTMASKKGGP